ncbi:hypothetical protein N802_04120 [Knoellia sinensis KCTC 19936]|uniref:Probable membrane transporter protein n=2 Tax=Knoellia TaxID=136099 RepID=A0A0A0J1H7_9MICO|nr:hypothetical protein N802_04120 [Knoellia sinensis KCTC 19936]
MIGLGGAEFRLPLLIGVFGFLALQAVILNKAMSLLVVATALPARLVAVPLDQLAPHWPIVVNLLTGSLLGAYLGAGWATRMANRTLYRVLAILLILIAAALLTTHLGDVHPSGLDGPLVTITGIAAGAGIGVVAALMGVAGGELLIPTIVLLYGSDIKLAGSLSLAVSLPTMLVAFARYSQDQSFTVLARNRTFSWPWPPDPSSAPSPAAHCWASSLPNSSCHCWPHSSSCPRTRSGNTGSSAPKAPGGAYPYLPQVVSPWR